MCEKCLRPTPPAIAGVRKRRLWDLPAKFHCPVIGVCIPFASLRSIVDRLLDSDRTINEYELHSGVVRECQRRSPLSEKIQLDLDRRHTLIVSQYKSAKTPEALTKLWEEAVIKGDIAGPFWAVLSHARCTEQLQERVYQQVHMIQHQAGAQTRESQDQYRLLLQENAALTVELGKAQLHCSKILEERAKTARRHEALLSDANMRLIGKDQEIQQLHESLKKVSSHPDSEKRISKLHSHIERLEQVLQRLRKPAIALTRTDEKSQTMMPEECSATHTSKPVQLHQKSILCVGGRSANQPRYRQLVESFGGNFAHHDGGQEDSHALLDRNLSSADLVICQTACISHTAYWRVKDHCKRTGKKCVFLDNPSTTSFFRGLQVLQRFAAPVAPVTLTI